MEISGTGHVQLMQALGGSVGGAEASTRTEPPAPAPSGADAAGAVAADRMAQLLAGAAPATEAERIVVARAEQVLQGTVATLGALVSEAARQARLGLDVHGRPLQGREDHAHEQRVLDLVNVERAQRGLPALFYDRMLDAASEAHNQQQVATRTMAHDGIGDGNPGSRIRSTGFNRAWGENVATGQLTPEQVVAEWMASPGHRRNILDPEFRRLGVSYATASDGRSYWAQSFGA